MVNLYLVRRLATLLLSSISLSSFVVCVYSRDVNTGISFRYMDSSASLMESSKPGRRIRLNIDLRISQDIACWLSWGKMFFYIEAAKTCQTNLWMPGWRSNTNVTWPHMMVLIEIFNPQTFKTYMYILSYKFIFGKHINQW